MNVHGLAELGQDRFRRPSNGQYEQPNHPDYEDCECYGIIVEPMLPLCVHDLKPSLERVPDSRPNAAKAVTCVTGGVEDGHARPMTAQVDGERGPIWLFTAKDSHDFAHRGLLEWLSNTPLPPLSGPSG